MGTHCDPAAQRRLRELVGFVHLAWVHHALVGRKKIASFFGSLRAKHFNCENGCEEERSKKVTPPGASETRRSSSELTGGDRNWKRGPVICWH